ncbi:MAG: cardiolipin synthase [Planctomycetota bacterium]
MLEVHESIAWLLQSLAFVHAFLVITFSIRILLRDDLSPAARLAWFMVMLLAPYFGVAVYLLFGEISLGRSVHSRHDEIFARMHEVGGHLLGSCNQVLPDCVEIEYQTAFRAASVDGFETTNGNQGELMPDAMTARHRLIEDIDSARKSVQCLYYIWLDDKTGVDVANALIRAAKRGISCHAMADGLGSKDFIRSEHWDQMRESGVHLAIALPIKGLLKTILFSRLDLRNHRKITVIDGQITYCGSQNCADPEFRVKPKFAPWVDVMLRLEGPIVAQCQLLFATDWQLNSNEDIASSLATQTTPIDGGFPAQLFADGPTERRGATPQLFATLLALAKSELVISTPYFVPDQTVLDALCAAAIRGIKVTMIFPKRNDSWIVSAASKGFYRQLLIHGVEIFEFREGLLHSKTLTIDQKLTLIGSTNLDQRSFDLNYENDVLFRDDALTREVFDRQQAYVTQSDTVTLDEVQAWSFSRRIWNNVVATVGPIL